MTTASLGRLERVELRDIWTSEATAFTPWLARTENLALLGEALELELELEAQERAVGPFRADILCKDIERDAWVLIENQLERTDHTHLGQLLTYASGLQAVTIVWIAARFTEEHRSTLDWLNDITDESFRFFGIEVELWKIADSPAAPKFNIVSKPNDWSRSVARAARAIDEDSLSATHGVQLAYWTALQTVLEAAGGPVGGHRTPQPKAWMTYSIGRTGIRLSSVVTMGKRRIHAELYLQNPLAKEQFALLRQGAAEVERELGYPLSWEELPGRQACRIATYHEDVDPADEADWPRQHRWLADRLNDLHRVFAPRVRALDADGSQHDPGSSDFSTATGGEVGAADTATRAPR